jgi:hypothetical protein
VKTLAPIPGIVSRPRPTREQSIAHLLSAMQLPSWLTDRVQVTVPFVHVDRRKPRVN